jgi:predicted XRE-type DNA-binding protein
MQKRIIEGVEVQRSSGNVYADLGLPDADKLKIKTGLVIEIRKAMRTLGLNQQAAAARMGIPQPKVSGMMRGDFTNLSERKLMDCLNRLGYDIEIKVRPATEPVGHLTLDEQVSHMMINLEEVQATLSQLTTLYPDSLCNGGMDGDE